MLTATVLSDLWLDDILYFCLEVQCDTGVVCVQRQ